MCNWRWVNKSLHLELYPVLFGPSLDPLFFHDLVTNHLGVSKLRMQSSCWNIDQWVRIASDSWSGRCVHIYLFSEYIYTFFTWYAAALTSYLTLMLFQQLNAIIRALL